jgi:hypothetical protein
MQRGCGQDQRVVCILLCVAGTLILIHLETPSCVPGGSRVGVSWTDSLKCQTPTAPPAGPGGLPVELEVELNAKLKDSRF